MDVIIKENEFEVADYLSNQIIEKLKENNLITLASGDTVLETYRLVVEKYQSNPFSIKATVVNLDEWVGLDKYDEGGCQYHMFNDLYNHLNIPDNQLIVFNAKAEDLDAECKRIDGLIGNRKFDYVLLGIGMNGHLALNEPGCNFENKAFYTELDETTKVVMNKYFNKEVHITKGISLGIKYFVESKELVTVVTCSRKHDICQKVILSEVTNEIPATSIKLNNNSKLIMDLNCYRGE